MASSSFRGDGSVAVSETFPSSSTLKKEAPLSNSCSSSNEHHHDSNSKAPPVAQPKLSFFSAIFFSWMSKWIYPAYAKAALTASDLFPLPEDADSALLFAKLSHWRSHQQPLGKPFRIRPMINALFWPYQRAVYIFQCVETCLKIVGCFVVYLFIEKLEAIRDSSSSSSGSSFGYSIFITPLSLAFLIVILLIVNSAAHHQVFWRGGHLGTLIRATLSCAIFSKLTNLSLGASDAAAGEILNMVSNDVGKLEDFASFSHFLWFAPFEAVLVCAFVLIITHTWSLAFLIMGVFLVLVAFQFFLSKRCSGIRAKVVASRDQMIKYMTDVLMGVQIVKYYAWESAFSARIQKTRDICMGWLWRAARLKAVNSIIYYVANDALTLLMIGFAVFQASDISASSLISSRMMFASIILVICNFFPRSVELYTETKISIERIEKFLNQQEIEVRDEVGDPKGHLIWFREASFGFPDAPLLGPLTLKADAGELVVIVGPVGSGKSALLASVLGEIPLIAGDQKRDLTESSPSPSSGNEFAFKGPVAYASQQPWLMNCSIRQNITMGKPWNAVHYQRVLEACCLVNDLEGMPLGDCTLVGERGSALSGGQRARVSLARALYFQEARIYLLDDVLSAVDTAVGNSMVQAIRKMLLGTGKLCLLVTHQLQFVRFASQVVVLEGAGKVAFVGTYAELMRRSGQIAFVDTLMAYDSLQDDVIDDGGAGCGNVPEAEDERDLLLAGLGFGAAESDISLSSSSMSEGGGSETESTLIKQNSSSDCDIIKCENDHNPNHQDQDDSHAVEQDCDDSEDRSQGSVGFSIYRQFFGPAFWLLLGLVGVFLAGQIILVVFQLQVLDSLSESVRISREDLARGATIFFIELGLFAFGILLFYRTCMQASRAIFRTILQSLLRSPLSFFQRQPLGRILNRFSKDQTAVDEQLFCNLSDAILQTFRTSICFIMTMRDISWTSTPLLLGGFALLAWRLWGLFRTFFKVSRDLKRIEAVTRSPLYAHLASCLEGLPQIRAHSLQPAMLRKHQKRQNTNTQALYTFLGASRWFAFAVDFSCCFFTLCYLFVALGMIAMNYPKLLDPLIQESKKKDIRSSITMLVASINFCQEIAESVQWTARLIAEVEMGMTNVERVVQYTSIPHEAPVSLPQDKVLDPSWPAHGKITFQNVSVWYEGQPKPALSQVDCEIASGQRVALVGRTGAGKSSFLSALFRMTQHREGDGGGKIEIDGVAICTLGLDTLRSRLCIIPQEPYLFLGDLRFNLDPFHVHTDLELWEALRIVQLAERVAALPSGLGSTTAKEAMSIGERQLVCMARALLKSGTDSGGGGGVVVMDEATANIDLATSHAIQDAVKRVFSRRTLCTIAHRLHTIIDYDRIVVLDGGKIVEVGSPRELLEMEGGHFASMVAELGPDGEKRLREMVA